MNADSNPKRLAKSKKSGLVLVASEKVVLASLQAMLVLSEILNAHVRVDVRVDGGMDSMSKVVVEIILRDSSSLPKG
jgi:hypothetical protein